MAVVQSELKRQLEQALALPPEQRARYLLESPKPMALVRALPDGEFYLTAREIGPQGALSLLALSSASQLNHLLDLESWRGDRFDALRSGAWVALLVEAGDPTLKRFTHAIDDEALILLFRLWARVRALDIDHEEPTRGHGIGDVGDERGFLSPDGANLFNPERSEHAFAVRRLAEFLYVEDRARYLGIIRSALFELPSELEEEALHWRQSRLEEHGYPGREEALSIYAPPARGEIAKAAPPTDGDDAEPTAPRAAIRVLGENGLIPRGVSSLAPAERERILFGLTALANRVLVADAKDPGSLEAHVEVIRRAGAYVELALEARGATTTAAAAAVLAEAPAVELFREGYAHAAALQVRARRMLDAWGGKHARALDVIDPPLEDRIAALLLPRPLFLSLDPKDDDDPRSDFRSLSQIDETRVTLELCEALGETLLVRRGLTAADLLTEERKPFEDTPRFSTLLLTAMAWLTVRGEVHVDRLPADLVADFLRTTASRKTADPAAPARAMSRLVDVLATESELAARPTATLRAFGASCLPRLAADCGNLDPGMPVTPRVVGCLRLA